MSLPPLVVAREAIAATGRPGQWLAERLWMGRHISVETNSADRPLAGWSGVSFDIDVVARIMVSELHLPPLPRRRG